MNYGWICPKCGKVYAPTVVTCSCDMWNQWTPYYTQPYTWKWPSTCNLGEKP